VNEHSAVIACSRQHVPFFELKLCANVQVVIDTNRTSFSRASFDRTIHVFTEGLSSDRMIVNQFLYEVTHYGKHSPRCQGRMRLLAVIHSPESIRKILGCLGLPCVRRQSRRSAIEFRRLPSHSCRQDK